MLFLRGFLHQSETRNIKIVRITFMIFSYTLVLTYLLWKLYELSKLDKTIIYTRKKYSTIPAPNVYIGSYKNFTIECEYTYGGHINIDSKSDCSQKISRIYNSTLLFPFVAIFKSNLTLISHIEDNADSIDFSINSTGSLSMTYINFNFSTNQTGSTRIQVFEPEMDIIRNNRTLLDSISKESSDFIDDLEYSNTYLAGPGNSYFFRFTKQIRDVLINPLENMFSLSAKYDILPYIISNLATTSTPNVGNHSTLSIGCISTTVETEKEKLISTLFDVCAFAGGLFTLVTSINVLLFGETIRNPWGVVHILSCCGIKRNVQNTLYDYLKDQIPFADEGAHLESPPEKIEDRVRAIEQRHRALEFLLRDYVINVDILNDKDVNNRFYKYTKIKNEEISKEE